MRKKSDQPLPQSMGSQLSLFHSLSILKEKNYNSVSTELVIADTVATTTYMKADAMQVGILEQKISLKKLKKQKLQQKIINLNSLVMS